VSLWWAFFIANNLDKAAENAIIANMKTLIIDRLHTTKLGIERIKQNLGLRNQSSTSFQNDEKIVMDYCKAQIKKAAVERRGKNWYATIGDEEYTINVFSHTIITAHRKDKA